MQPARTTLDTTSDIDDAPHGNRAQRREQQATERSLLREVERRNRAQLVPHYATGGLVALAGAIHHAAMQAGTLSAAALLAGVGVAATGTTGYLWLRRTGRLLSGWRLWNWAVITAASAWMVLAVAHGLTWTTMAAALGADYALGARWWRRHRHPVPQAPQTPLVERVTSDVDVDDALVAGFQHRFTTHVGSDGGALSGAQLLNGQPFEHGIEYTLKLNPGKHTLDTVRSTLSLISSGIGWPEEKLVPDKGTTSDPALAVLRVITTSPVEDHLYFRRPEFVGGDIALGPYADGIGQAVWRLYSDNSMHNGLVIGQTGSGKSRLLELIGLCALHTGKTYVIHVDGQDGKSCPQLWRHAHERYDSEQVLDVLARITAMQKHRQKNPPPVPGALEDEADEGFTPAPDYPGILVIVDEANEVVDKENVSLWRGIARQARKVGIALVLGDQDGSLETFQTSVFRGSLRAGNAVGFKTEERSQGQIIANGRFNLVDLPDIPGYAYTLGKSSRHAPFKARYLVARKDARKLAEKGTPLPADVSVIEDQYARAPKIALDPATRRAGDAVIPAPDTGRPRGGDQEPTPASAPVRESAPARAPARGTLVAMPLPTLTPGDDDSGAETTPAPDGELTDSQYQVWDTVRLGVDQTGRIAEQLGLSRQRVGTVLTELVRRGLVEKTGSGSAVRYTPAQETAAV